MQQPEGKKKYTYADYLTWDNDTRYELIDGVPYMMSAPSVNHQRILRGLFMQLANYLEGKSCEMFSSPFDVRLNANTEDNTVVQPDITVICDPKKIENGKSCEGTPDMVIEILSHSTASRDQVLKFDRYLKAGIKEYWLVNPDSRTVLVFLLKNGEYVGKPYGDTDTISVHIFEDCQIDLAKVFPPEPQVEPAQEPVTPEE